MNRFDTYIVGVLSTILIIIVFFMAKEMFIEAGRNVDQYIHQISKEEAEAAIKHYFVTKKD